MDLEIELKKRALFFNKELAKFLKILHPEKLYSAAGHLPFAGGKRLRPIISMVTCEAVEGDISKVIPLTIGIELIHNFTLVHDDIMDKSKLRRNLPSVHIKYGEPTAIMAGDLLFTKAFESMHNITSDCKIFKDVEFGLIDCIKEICEGQQLDIEFETKKNIKEEEYIEMIRKKTAVFFQYAAEAGAKLGEGTNEEINLLNQYGLNLGLGFQIWDDFLDMSSSPETLGKDIGNDIRNGKKTLIAVHAINNASNEDKKNINKIFGNIKATDKEVKQVYDIFKKIGSIIHAKNTAIMYIDKAKNSLNNIKDSKAKEILLLLADYSIKREK